MTNLLFFILGIFSEKLRYRRHHKHHPMFEILFIKIGENGELINMGSTGTILDNQVVPIVIGNGVDAAGFSTGAPPVFDAPPTYSATPAGAVFNTPAGGGATTVGGAPGVYTVNVAGSVGGVAQSATGTLTIDAGGAVSFTISFGAAQPAAPVAPAS